MLRFIIQNFGCRATQADGAAIAGQLTLRGMRASDDARAADLVVMNTCTVTAAADEDARQAIRRVHRENPECRILVTGCYAQRAPAELAVLPGVAWVVGNSHKNCITEIVAGAGDFVPLSALTGAEIHVGNVFAHTELQAPAIGNVSLNHIGGGGGRTRPNVKIQDGCDNRCSFCIIPSVRGRSRSLGPAAVIAQVRELERAGFREIVLTGINLGRWGRDARPRLTFPGLLRGILAETAIERIRLSSVEPMDFTDEVLELMAGSPRIARHVHAPLQSGSDRVLRLMRRRYRAEQYARRLARAAELMPDAAFGADVMVAFPGETGDDFERTRALVERLPFTYLHVFTWSPRAGTPAESLPGRVDPPAARARHDALVELAAAKNLEFRRRQLGQRLPVITLRGGAALSDNYLKVRLEGAALPANTLADVRVTALERDRLVGTVERACLPEVRPGGGLPGVVRANLPESPAPAPVLPCE